MKALSSIGVLLTLLVVPPAAAQQPPTIDGWGNLKFGMTIDEVVKATPEIPWGNVESCKKPNPKYAYAYCLLAPVYEQYSVTLAGVEFEPRLTFDQHGKLVHISLTATDRYSKSSTAQTCQQDAARIADGVAARFGPLQTGGNLKATDLAAHNAWTDARTKANDQMNKWKPTEPQLVAPALPPRSLVSAAYYFGSSISCRQYVDYVSAPLPRPLPKDTGKF